MELHGRGEVLHITAQNLIEFRNVATHPVAIYGLGLIVVEAETKTAIFLLLPETPDIFPVWKAIVEALAVVGKQFHDARLVAVYHAYHISHLLAFNVAHFIRLAASGPVLAILDPSAA